MDKIAMYKEQIMEKVAQIKRNDNGLGEFKTSLKHYTKTNRLSDSEFNALTDKLNKEYGANIMYVNSEKSPAGASFYLPYEGIQKMNPKLKKYLKIPETNGKDYAVIDHTELSVLHETGHALDADKFNRGKRLKRNMYGAMGSLGLTIAGGVVPYRNIGIPMAALGTAGGVFFTDRAGRITEKSEDIANDFVMKYLEKKYNGDKAKAQYEFDHSHLPKGRETYTRQRHTNDKNMAIGLGGMATATALAREIALAAGEDDVNMEKVAVLKYKKLIASLANRNRFGLRNKVFALPREVMKRQGHSNEKAVAELKRQAFGHVSVRHSNFLSADAANAVNGNTRFEWNDNYTPSRWDITLPNKSARSVNLKSDKLEMDANTAKQVRAITARHEISGEAVSTSKMLRALKNKKLLPTANNLSAFNISSHQNPEVLNDDASFVKRLSSNAQKINNEVNNLNKVNFKSSKINNGDWMNESQMMSSIRPGANKYDPKDIEKVPYTKRAPLTKKELKGALINIGIINKGKENVDTTKELADEYIKTPFFRTWKNKGVK